LSELIRLDPGAIATVTIDRPARRNALNLDALNELDVAVRAAVDDGARCLILNGASGHFCAGADIKELEDLAFTRRLREVLDHLAELPIVTIAHIEGSCMGLGMQLAVSVDVRVAAPDAKFAVPVAKLGLMVDHWTLQRLAVGWGQGAARHMALTAEVLTAEDGHRLGFIQQIGDLDDARAIAARVTTLAPLSIAGTKLGFNLLERRLDEPDFQEAFRTAWESDDLAEGQKAFGERRAPEFRGR
jgi:enoyl-CoA hydratase